MKTTGEIRIGVIGAGRRSKLALLAHRPGEGIRIVGASDVNEDALNQFSQSLDGKIESWKNYKDMLECKDINLVFITSPDYLHQEHAVNALKAGKDVFLEKPMAIDIEGCDRILETAKKTGRKLYLGHNMRHMEFVLKMKDLVDSGAIGKVKAVWCRHFVGYGGDAYFKDWHAERDKSTGLLLQKGTHDIDVLHWICGGYTKCVTAFGNLTVYNQVSDRHDPSVLGDATWNKTWPPLSQKGLNPVISVEDISMMLMQLDTGVMCSYQQCHYTPDSWRNYTIIGTEGRIENCGDEPGSCVIRLWNKASNYNPSGDQQFTIPPAEGDHGGADPKMIDEFLQFVRGQGQSSTSPISARCSVAAGYMATCSLRNNGLPMDVPPVPKDILSYFTVPAAKDRPAKSLPRINSLKAVSSPLEMNSTHV
jgi:predicted dehydrogenase